VKKMRQNKEIACGTLAQTPPVAPTLFTRNGMLVRVEGDALAVALQITSRCRKILEGRLRRDKLQVHQPAGRIIEEDEQGALRAAVLTPPMLQAVDGKNDMSNEERCDLSNEALGDDSHKTYYGT
jgi:hypothetical protein